MSDLRERLSAFDRLEFPDLWEEVQRRSRSPGPEPSPTKGRRLVAVVVALIVFVPAAVLLVRAFSRDETHHSAVSSGEAPAIFFPVEQERPNAGMAALLTSKLEVHHGCLFAGSHQDTLLLWPYGAHLAHRIAGEPLKVLDETGRVIAIEGQHVHMGGGYVSEDPDRTAAPERIVGTPIPARCRPSYGYWLVSDADTVSPQATPPSIGGTPTPSGSGQTQAADSGGRSTPPSKPLANTIRLFHGRTNDHFWNLDAAHRGRTWGLVLTSTSGQVLFEGRQTLGAAHPAVYGHYTWSDPGGPASIVFGLGRLPHADALRVRTDSIQRRATLTEDVHPTGLPSMLRFFLQDFSGKIRAIQPVEKA